MTRGFFVFTLVIALLTVSCAGAPKSQEDTPVTVPQNDTAAVQETEPPAPAPVEITEPEPAETVETESAEPEPAELFIEEIVPVIPEEEALEEETVIEPDIAELFPEDAAPEENVEPILLFEPRVSVLPKIPETEPLPAEAPQPIPPVLAEEPPPAAPQQPLPPEEVPPEPDDPPPPVPAEPSPEEIPPAAGEIPPADQNVVPPEPDPAPDNQSRPNEVVNISRTARATVGQYVEIPFRGTGWVYLGEINARRGIVYDSRRLDPEGQSFIFKAEAAGTYTLKFFRQDFIRDFILNDHVQVIVGEPPENAVGWFNPPAEQSRVIAGPRWPSSLEEARALRGTVPQTQPIPGAEDQTGSVAQESQAAADSPADTQAPLPAAPPPIPPAQPQEQAPPEQAAAPARENTTQRPPAAPVQQTPATEQPPAATVPPAVETQAPPSPASAVPEQTPAAADENITVTSPPPAAETPIPPETVSDTSPLLPDDSLPQEYVKKAGEELDAGRAVSAIALLDKFRELYPSGSDEAWWLYGQSYEANSPGRNILAALDYYRRLVREYPQSARANDARRRISYLERYYININ